MVLAWVAVRGGATGEVRVGVMRVVGVEALSAFREPWSDGGDP